jgi:hypothetical protein
MKRLLICTMCAFLMGAPCSAAPAGMIGPFAPGMSPMQARRAAPSLAWKEERYPDGTFFGFSAHGAATIGRQEYEIAVTDHFMHFYAVAKNQSEGECQDKVVAAVTDLEKWFGPFGVSSNRALTLKAGVASLIDMVGPSEEATQRWFAARDEQSSSTQIVVRGRYYPNIDKPYLSVTRGCVLEIEVESMPGLAPGS